MPSERYMKIDRVCEIAERLVAAEIEAGTLDEHDEEAMEAACRQAVRDAITAYDAAMEYLSG